MNRLSRQQQFERIDAWLLRFSEEAPFLFNVFCLGVACVIFAAICAIAGL